MAVGKILRYFFGDGYLPLADFFGGVLWWSLGQPGFDTHLCSWHLFHTIRFPPTLKIVTWHGMQWAFKMPPHIDLYSQFPSWHFYLVHSRWQITVTPFFWSCLKTGYAANPKKFESSGEVNTYLVTCFCWPIFCWVSLVNITGWGFKAFPASFDSLKVDFEHEPFSKRGCGWMKVLVFAVVYGLQVGELCFINTESIMKRHFLEWIIAYIILNPTKPLGGSVLFSKTNLWCLENDSPPRPFGENITNAQECLFFPCLFSSECWLPVTITSCKVNCLLHSVLETWIIDLRGRFPRWNIGWSRKQSCITRQVGAGRWPGAPRDGYTSSVGELLGHGITELLQKKASRVGKAIFFGTTCSCFPWLWEASRRSFQPKSFEGKRPLAKLEGSFGLDRFVLRASCRLWNALWRPCGLIIQYWSVRMC